MAGTRLYRVLSLRGVSQAVVSAVCAELGQRFGEQSAMKLADEPWFVEYEAWGTFVKEYQEVLLTFGGECDEVRLWTQIQSVLFRVFHFVVTQQEEDCRVRQLYDSKTDEDQIRELKCQGWGLFVASGDKSNCLAHALLHLLILAGLVRDDLNRIEVCRANREELLLVPNLVPRDIANEPKPYEYLEHHRHAGPTILYFVKRFGCVGDLPRAGVKVVVRVRCDDVLPYDIIDVCGGLSAKSGPPLVFHLYNWTGRGFSGYHYDALIPPAGSSAIADASAPAAVGAVSLPSTEVGHVDSDAGVADVRRMSRETLGEFSAVVDSPAADVVVAASPSVAAFDGSLQMDGSRSEL